MSMYWTTHLYQVGSWQNLINLWRADGESSSAEWVERESSWSSTGYKAKRVGEIADNSGLG